MLDGGDGGQVRGVETRQAPEPALDVDFFEAGLAAVETRDGAQVIQRPVHKVVLAGGQRHGVAEAAEAGAHQRAAARRQVRPLAGRQGERLSVHVLSIVGYQHARVLRQTLVGGETHAHHRGVRQLHRLQRSRGLGGNALQQQRGRRGRHGKDNVVIHHILAAFEAVSCAIASQGGDKRVDVDVGTGLLR